MREYYADFKAEENKIKRCLSEHTTRNLRILNVKKYLGKSILLHRPFGLVTSTTGGLRTIGNELFDEMKLSIKN
jgi:hypothetical protein